MSAWLRSWSQVADSPELSHNAVVGKDGTEPFRRRVTDGQGEGHSRVTGRVGPGEFFESLYDGGNVAIMVPLYLPLSVNKS
ncbi:hypothetical protein BHM03_00048769 [Ensete ventricosum]|nr:hypothetical protein BHM03_00048769 [Ensete ventricosum]